MTNYISKEEALLETASRLDISPSKYKQAIERYTAIKNFLIDGDYDGTASEPIIYLQGSFKLGTEIRPFINSRDADYDIDLVCQLDYLKTVVSPEKIKHQVGNHIRSNGTYERMLKKEGKRCWTLNYAEEDGVGFHVDILPSIADSAPMTSMHSIAATNKNKDASYIWITSNPRGFSEWFYSINREAFNREKANQKQQVFERQKPLYQSVNDVPDIHVKTPLQRAIQILKRHRDVRFSQSGDEQYKPISMIITVLAGKNYRNETTIIETLNNFISTLSSQATQMQENFSYRQELAESKYNLITRTPDGRWLIPNPTNPGENFADRWHEDNHARARAFFGWIGWLKDEILNIHETVENDFFTKALIEVNQNSRVPAIDFSVSHKQAPLWPMQLNTNYTAEIKARYKASTMWTQFESGQPILKGKELRFKLITNVPRPYRVFWQVVNTGNEAAAARKLRGGIFEHMNFSTADIFRTESSLYTGDHWVECFVIKDGVCIARTGEFIVSIRNSYIEQGIMRSQ